MSELYSNWLNQETVYIPRKFKHKKFPNEDPTETEIKEQLSVEKMKAEIKILKQRAEKFEGKFSGIDDSMFESIENLANGRVLDKLREIWLSECNSDVDKIRKIWEKKKEWFLQTKQEAENNNTVEEDNGNQAAAPHRHSGGNDVCQRAPGRRKSRHDAPERFGGLQRHQGPRYNRQKPARSNRTSWKPPRPQYSSFNSRGNTPVKKVSFQAPPTQWQQRGRSKMRRSSSSRKSNYRQRNESMGSNPRGYYFRRANQRNSKGRLNPNHKNKVGQYHSFHQARPHLMRK